MKNFTEEEKIFEICKIAYKQGWKDSIENMQYDEGLDEIDTDIINEIIDESHIRVVNKYKKIKK